MMTNIVATMKRDDCDFSLVIFDKLISLAAKYFTFSLFVEQVYFVDDLNNLG